MSLASAQRWPIFLIIFSQFDIILALDMSDPYWPLILSASNQLSATKLAYWSGAIYMAPLLATIFTTILWTKIGERVGYKKMVLRAGFALAITQWGLFFFSDPWVILSIRLIQGGLAGFTAAAQAWSLSMTPVNNHSQVVGYLQTATALGSIVGPVFGGIVTHYYGQLSIFLFSGSFCSLVSAVLAKYLTENNSRLERSMIKNPPRFLLNDPAKNRLLLLMGATQAARWMSMPFFALYVVKQLKADSLTLGFLYAIMALAISLVASIVGRLMSQAQKKLLWPKCLLIFSLVLSGIVQWGFAFVSKAYFAFGLSLFFGSGLGAISVLLFSFLLNEMEETSRAQAIGLANTALKAGNLLGILGGTLIQANGCFSFSFLIIGFFYIGLALLASSYE